MASSASASPGRRVRARTPFARSRDWTGAGGGLGAAASNNTWCADELRAGGHGRAAMPRRARKARTRPQAGATAAEALRFRSVLEERRATLEVICVI